MMIKLQKNNKRNKRCIVISVLLLVLSSAIAALLFHQSALEQAQLQRIKKTSISQLSCLTICSAYPVDSGDSCCKQGLSSCFDKQKCRNQTVLDIEGSINTKETMCVIFIAWMIFFSMLAVVLFLCRILIKRQIHLLEFGQPPTQHQRLIRQVQRQEQRIFKRRLDKQKQNRRNLLLNQSYLSEDGNQNCSICLEGVSNKTVNKLRCGHLFHSQCILDWVEDKGTCPVCRKDQDS